MVRLSDARMSGTSYGTCVLHVSPESPRSAARSPSCAMATASSSTSPARRLHLDVPESRAHAPPRRVAAAGRRLRRAATASSSRKRSPRRTKAATSASSTPATLLRSRIFSSRSAGSVSPPGQKAGAGKQENKKPGRGANACFVPAAFVRAFRLAAPSNAGESMKAFGDSLRRHEPARQRSARYSRLRTGNALRGYNGIPDKRGGECRHTAAATRCRNTRSPGNKYLIPAAGLHKTQSPQLRRFPPCLDLHEVRARMRPFPISQSTNFASPLATCPRRSSRICWCHSWTGSCPSSRRR